MTSCIAELTKFVIALANSGLILYETKKLRTCTVEEVESIRQKILAYESVINLPQNVIDRESE